MPIRPVNPNNPTPPARRIRPAAQDFASTLSGRTQSRDPAFANPPRTERAAMDAVMRDSAERQTRFAASLAGAPLEQMLAGHTLADGTSGEDVAAMMREASVQQTYEGMVRNPFMVEQVREMIARPDYVMRADPENDQLMLALRRYDEAHPS
jgi:hypothetical protein